MNHASRIDLSETVNEGLSTPCSTSNNCKYRSLSCLIRDSVSCKDFEAEIERLINLMAHVDDYDPEECDCTPLRLAVQNRLLDWTKILLLKGADPGLACIETEFGLVQTVTDLAWSNGDYDIVLELLIADGPFPQNFDSDKLTISQRQMFNAVILKVRKLHEYIAKNSLDVVVAFAENYPETKHAYHVNNRSAITTALESKKFRIYAFLASMGFARGIDKSHDFIIDDLKLLNDFSEDKQIKFLTKIWLGKSGTTDLTSNAKHLLERFEASSIQKHISLENPLQLFMLADLTRTNPGSLNFDFEHFSLADFFIRNRIAIWKVSADKSKILPKEFNILFFLQKIALESLFGKKATETLQFLKIYEALNEELICELGFVQISFNQGYQFSHQTFVDVFIAHTLVKGITTQSFTINPKVPQGNNDIYFQKQISRKLEELLNLESCYEFLIHFIEQKQYNLIGMIFKKLELTTEVKMKIIKHKNSSNYNSLHVATGCVESWNFLWSFVEKFANESERKDILLTRGGDNAESILKMSQGSGKEVHDIIYKIHDELFAHSCELINSLYIKSFEKISQEKKMTAFEILWCSIQDHFEPKHVKQLLFVGRSFGLFFDLILSPFAIELALKAAKKIFNRVELKNAIIQTGWLHNTALLSALSSKIHKKLLLSFFEEFFDTSDDKKKIEVFVERIKAQKESLESESYTECLVIEKTLEALSKLLEIDEFKENNSKRLFKCIGQTSVQISSGGHAKIFTLLWNFVRKNFEKGEQRQLLLFDYKSLNTVTALTHNDDELISKNVLKEMENLFDQTYFRKVFCIQSNKLLVDTFCYFTANAKLHSLTLIWSFFNDKLNKEDHKALFLQKNKKGVNALMESARNKDKSATEFVIDIARNLLGAVDFVTALQSKNQNWIVDTLCFFAEHAESEAFSMFWQFLQENLDTNYQKLIFLQRKPNTFNTFMASAGNKDMHTIELVMKIARELLVPEDITEALKSKDQNWVTETLKEYISVEKLEAFLIFWSFYQEKLDIDSQKLTFLSKNPGGGNASLYLAQNKEKSVVEVVLNAFRSLLSPEDFKAAMNAGEQNWIVDALCRYAYIADSESFGIFWTFLQENLDKKQQKLVFQQKKENKRNALMISAQNENIATVELVFNTASGLLDPDDFATALKSGNGNWLVETLCSYVSWARYEAFIVFWSFFQKNLSKNDQKEVFLQKNDNYQNVFICCADSEDKSTIAFVLNQANKLLGPEGFATDARSRHQSWLVNTLCNYVVIAECEAFRTFWTFLCGNLDKEKQKLLFLQKDYATCAFENSCQNKDMSTIAFIVGIARELLTSDDFATAMKSEYENWIVNVLVQYSGKAETESLRILWSFIQENLGKEDQKRVLLYTTYSPNAFMAATQNKILSTIALLINIAKEVLTPEDFAKVMNAKYGNWIVDMVFNFVKNAGYEALSLFWSVLKEKLERDDQRLLLLQEKKHGKNAYMLSAENEDKTVAKFVEDTVVDLLNYKKFTIFLRSEYQNWLDDTLSRYAESESLEKFWSFLQNKIDKCRQKLVFLKRKQSGVNAFICSAKDKDESAVKLFINSVRGLVNSNDLPPHQSVLVDTLHQHSSFAESEAFAIFWTVLQQNLDQNDQKLAFVQRKQNGDNVTAFWAPNNSKRPFKLVLNESRNLFNSENFAKALKTGDRNWLFDIFTYNAAFAQSEAIKAFYSFLKDNLDRNCQKNNFDNSDKSSIAFVINTSRELRHHEDFAMVLKSEKQNWFIEIVLPDLTVTAARYLSPRSVRGKS